MSFQRSGSIRLLLAALGGILITLLWPLPDSVDEPAAVSSLRITDRDGGLLREARPDGRGIPVDLDAIEPIVVQALVATEDRRFYRHAGVDALAIAGAVWGNLRRGEMWRGGSTITMQVARLLRASAATPDRPYRRDLWNKLAETHLALRLELRLSKQQILEQWLNRAYFGNQTYGIEAAARLYFDKSASDLTAAEATLLVGLPQSPRRYDPFRHPEEARHRQRAVLAAMVRAGRLTAAEREAIEAMPLELTSPETTFRAPHLVQWLLAGAVGGTPHGAIDDPIELRTTIDAHLQHTVESLARSHLRRLEAHAASNAAALVIDNRSGEILAYVGSVDFWDERTGGQNDGVRMLRQPGSALKPFTYCLALEAGRYTAASILPDLELGLPGASGGLAPENYDREFHGPVRLREALACSYNLPPVHLLAGLGPERLLELLHVCGFGSLDRSAEHYGLGLTLGNGEVSLLELVRAYSALTRGGALLPLEAVAWRRTASGDTLRPPMRLPVPTGIDPAVAYLVGHILADGEARAPAFGRGGPLELPFLCAAKTGTSKDYRDNWTVGFTPRHTVGVWVGNFDGSPMRRVSGVSGAGPLFRSIMLHLGESGAPTRPDNIEEQVICRASGARPGRLCPDRQRELFIAGTAPPDTCAVHQLVRIDRATGELAAADTPASQIVERLYAIHPPEFHAWMRDHDLPLPPRAPPAHDQERPPPGGPAITERLRILYPCQGALYQIDPVLRTEFQRIELRAAADDCLRDIHWRIDGRRLAGDYRHVTWRLAPGMHRIELHATDEQGESLRALPVTVRAVEPAAGATASPGMMEGD
jgi:penicillin-binding protein 1C